MAIAKGGSDQPDRPKLVALPASGATAAEPQPEPGPADAAATTAGPAAAGAAAATAGAAATVGPAATAAATAGEGAAAAERAAIDRLALERSLSGPPALGPRVVGALLVEGAAATDVVPYASAPGLPPSAVQPPGLVDAIAVTAAPHLVQALRAELAMRAHAEAGLRARAVDAETRLAARVLLAQRTAETLVKVRAELDQLAGLLTDERARRQAAEQRVAELELELASSRGRSTDADAAVELRADRLSDALIRLRASTEPIDPAPPGPAAPSGLASVPVLVAATGPRATLSGPFRSLCRREPALAGRFALSLLSMQRIAYPHPVSYDIVLGPGHGCVQVTSGEAGTEIARQATARPLQQVDFQLVGGLERFAKLLAAGRIRRRFGFWVLARVRGNRDGLAALDALLALPLELPALVEAELSTDPWILAQLQAWIKRAQSE